MACPDFSYSDRGRRGIGVVQPQSGLDYPFVSRPDGGANVGPEPGVGSIGDIRYLVADFFLAYDDPGEYFATAQKVTPPLRIKYLYNVGCWENDIPVDFPTPRAGALADIVVVDAAGVVVFDTTVGEVEETADDWGVDYKLYTWRKADQVCQLVAYTTWTGADEDQKNFCKYSVPANAVLDARATYKMPRRLRRLYVKNGATTGPYTGKVQFSNGYNTTIVPEPTTVRDFRVNTRITFAAEPASGLGRYPNCGDGSELLPLKKINGIVPKEGGILLSGADCIWARRPVDVSSNQLSPSAVVQQQVGADCPPCCECADYAAAALYMNQVQSQYVLIGERVQDIKLVHEQNVARWLDQRECSTNPLKLYLIPQRCPYMDIVMMLCNPCQECIENSTLTTTLSAAATVQCGYTAMFAPGINGRAVPINAVNTGGGTQLSAQFPLVRGGNSVYLKLRVKFAVRAQYAVSGQLTGVTASGSPILTGCDSTPIENRSPATAAKVEALFCTEEGTTELPC